MPPPRVGGQPLHAIYPLSLRRVRVGPCGSRGHGLTQYGQRSLDSPCAEDLAFSSSSLTHQNASLGREAQMGLRRWTFRTIELLAVLVAVTPAYAATITVPANGGLSGFGAFDR